MRKMNENQSFFPTEGPCQDEFDVLLLLVQLECFELGHGS